MLYQPDPQGVCCDQSQFNVACGKWFGDVNNHISPLCAFQICFYLSVSGLHCSELLLLKGNITVES